MYEIVVHCYLHQSAITSRTCYQAVYYTYSSLCSRQRTGKCRTIGSAVADVSVEHFAMYSESLTAVTVLVESQLTLLIKSWINE